MRALARRLETAAELARAEWLLREQATVLGFAWTLLHPLLLFASLYAVCSHWLGRDRPDYAAALLIGIVHFNAFASGFSYGLTSLSRRRALLFNFGLAPGSIVLAAAASVAAAYWIELALLAPFLMALGIKPSAGWLLVPAVGLIHAAWTAGAALCVAPLAARFRDVERLWSAAATALFFLTPVFYRLDDLEGWRRALVSLNPLAWTIEAARGLLLGGPADMRLLAQSAASAAAALACGFWLLADRRRLVDDIRAS